MKKENASGFVRTDTLYVVEPRAAGLDVHKLQLTAWLLKQDVEAVASKREPNCSMRRISCDRARVVRRGHPFDDMELSVSNSWRSADGQLQLRVELPNGRRRTMTASWTSLEAAGENVSRTHGLCRRGDPCGSGVTSIPWVSKGTWSWYWIR